MNPTTYVHQCPECRLWQVEYDIDDMMSAFMALTVAPDGSLAANPKPMHDAIEGVLEDHYRDEHPLAFRRFKAGR